MPGSPITPRPRRRWPWAVLVLTACGGQDAPPVFLPGGREASPSPATGGDPAPQAGSVSATGGQRAPQAGAAPPQAGTGGGTAPDSGMPACQEFVMPDDCTVPENAVLPGELRCTGLYGDWMTRELACGVSAYRPAYALWSDGAAKARFVWLPPGTAVDVSNPDDFVYPVGTKFWKEFRVGPADQQRLGETRLMQKSDLGWIYTTYVWTEDLQNAIQQNDGVEDLHGTGHIVPSREDCKECHVGRPDYVLGWDFLMLGPGAEGITREQLAEAGLLSGLDSAQAALAAAIPGDDVERAALGYLHANCGISCHNRTSQAVGRPSDLMLRLNLAELATVQSTAAVITGVNQPPGPNAELVGLSDPGGAFYDFRPLDPVRSLSIVRMDFRGSPTAMPPIATHQVDAEGLALITAWVNQMTEDRGYAAAAP